MFQSWVAWNSSLELSQQGVATLLAWDDSSVMAELAHTQTLLRHMVFIREDRLFPVERVTVRNLGGVLGIEFSNELLRRPNQLIKRSLDLILGTAGLVIALPIVALCALLIKLVSPGPVFFRQQREGLGGRKFKVWKLRTMYATQKLGWPSSGSRSGPSTTMAAKRQITPGPASDTDGRNPPSPVKPRRAATAVECSSIGDMSLVGPRPFPDNHLAMLSSDFKRLRSAVRPGLTGLWQVMVRSNGRIEEQERFDTYYIQ